MNSFISKYTPVDKQRKIIVDRVEFISSLFIPHKSNLVHRILLYWGDFSVDCLVSLGDISVQPLCGVSVN